MTTTEVLNKVKLIDGVFTASEAADLMNSFLEEKINFHKLHRLAMREGDIYSDTRFDDSRVSQLMQDQLDFNMLCQQARANGKKLKINGIIEIEILDK